MQLQDFESKIVAAERSVERERGVVEALASRSARALELADIAASEAEHAEEAARVLNKFSDEQQATVIQTIESIASMGLSQIFGEDIQLVITPEIRARRLEMDIKVRTGDLETPILEARGGGLAAVAGFLLRACVLLLTPGARRLLVLDETFAMLSEEYLDNMGAFIQELCEKTGLQIVMVTHQTEFKEYADKVYRIEKVGKDTSRFVEEK